MDPNAGAQSHACAASDQICGDQSALIVLDIRFSLSDAADRRISFDRSVVLPVEI
jgi:hypothetical protein